VKKRTFESKEKLPPPNLTVPRAIAHQKIQEQIDKGWQLRKLQINNSVALDEAHLERSKWAKYNSELLLRLFDNSTMVDEYNRFLGGVISMSPTFPQLLHDFQKDIDESINRLEAIRDRLDLIPEPKNTEVSTTPSQASPKSVGQDVFLVHGHDEASKEAASRFIEKLGFKVVILHEQPNGGRTIIEKFEDNSNVGFAIILLTPDDIGAMRDKPTDGKPRARQNVILELGYFIAKLGRERVCALYKEEVELPSDIYGLLYVPLDTAGAWLLSLAKEMKHAGFPVDMNKAI